VKDKKEGIVHGKRQMMGDERKRRRIKVLGREVGYDPRGQTVG